MLALLLILPAHAGRIIEVKPDRQGPLQSAIDSIPKGRKSTYTIRLAAGTYREKIAIPAGMPPIALEGSGATTTVISWADSARTTDASGQELGTFRSATMTVEADDLSATGLTIENAFGTGSQAVALRVSGDRCRFRGVTLRSWQDTLLVEKKRQYFEGCTILGHVDFIFGGSAAWFEQCTLVSRGNGYLTAASTPGTAEFGLVFHRCVIQAEAAAKRVFLGRPWQNHPSTCFLECRLPEEIDPAGWDNWRDEEKEKTARYGEYRSSGPGANPDARVSWATRLTDQDAAKVTIDTVLSGWNPVKR
nr:pectinesterase family protein [Luteolibacter marinus]